MEYKIQKMGMMAERIIKAEFMSDKIEKYYKITSGGILDLFWIVKSGDCDYFDLIGFGNELMNAIASDITDIVNEDRDVEIYVTVEDDLIVICGMTQICISEINEAMDIPCVLNFIERAGFKTKQD